MEVKAGTYSSLTVREPGGESGGACWSCPSCNESVRSSDVDQHLELEIERLRQLGGTNVDERRQLLNGGDHSGGASADGAGAAEQRKPWSIFRKVQRNRHSRLRRSRKRPTPSSDQQTCPMCNVAFPQEQIQQHADRCLRRTNANNNGSSSSMNGNGGGGGGGDTVSDDEQQEGGEEYEEYEWAGQKRIRVSSLLVGGYASIGIGQTISNGVQSNGDNGDDDDDEDLNVDEDDTQIYGPAQYGENDVIDATSIETNATSDDGDVTNYMRHLITGYKPPPRPPSPPPPPPETSHPTSQGNAFSINAIAVSADIPATSTKSSSDASATASTAKSAQHYEQIIDSLKDRLRQCENASQCKLKCLICLDDYRKPAISVACWHVHCEECWLRSLGARKLCPQCNLITTPKDLRRIFM